MSPSTNASAVVVATLFSGGCMVGAGYLLHFYGWGVSGLAMFAGGALINLAFIFALRSRAASRRAVAEAGQRGHPHRRGDIAAPPWPQSAAVIALSLAAGAVMVLAGYAAAQWGWMLLVALILIGGLVILAAFALLVRT
jgi:hypothetical protein